MNQQQREALIKKIEAKKADILMKIATSEVNGPVVDLICEDVQNTLKKYMDGFSSEASMALTIIQTSIEVAEDMNSAGINVSCSCPNCRGRA